MKLEDLDKSLNKIVDEGVTGIAPILFLTESCNGEDKNTIVDLEEIFTKDVNRHEVFYKMGEFAHQQLKYPVVSIAMVAEGWAKSFPKDIDMSTVKKPSEYEDKKEIVQLSVLNANAKMCNTVMYTILRGGPE